MFHFNRQNTKPTEKKANGKLLPLSGANFDKFNQKITWPFFNITIFLVFLIFQSTIAFLLISKSVKYRLFCFQVLEYENLFRFHYFIITKWIIEESGLETTGHVWCIEQTDWLRYILRW